MRRNGLPAVPCQAVEDAGATQPHAVFARHEDATDVDRTHREAAAVHALEGRSDLNDVAPEHSFRQESAVRGSEACGRTGSGKGATALPERRRLGGRVVRLMVEMRERGRPGIGRERRERGEMRFVQRLRARMEVVDEDDS